MTAMEIINNARKAGYKFVRKTECPQCKLDMQETLKKAGITETPNWVNTKTAMLFYNKSKKRYIIACTCGARHSFSGGMTVKNHITCKTNGCKAILSQDQIDENDGYCWKCQPKKDRKTVTVTNTVDQDIYVLINDQEYVYTLDKAMHENFFKLLKHQPFKALNYIKNSAISERKVAAGS